MARSTSFTLRQERCAKIVVQNCPAPVVSHQLSKGRSGCLRVANRKLEQSKVEPQADTLWAKSQPSIKCGARGFYVPQKPQLSSNLEQPLGIVGIAIRQGGVVWECGFGLFGVQTDLVARRIESERLLESTRDHEPLCVVCSF